jgi:hypothetical protein
MIVVYHAAGDEAEADAILADGFVDWDGTYGTKDHWTGVWVSSRPPRVRQDEPILFVEIPGEAELRPYEWVPEELGYREWLVPAEVLNRFVRFRTVRGRPAGSITWTQSVSIATSEQMQAFRDAFGAEWSLLPTALRDAREWAAWEGFDDAGQRWLRFGDAQIVREAFSGIADVIEDDGRGEMRRNWWVEGIPEEAFPLTMRG